jgi:hypothetical protein
LNDLGFVYPYVGAPNRALESGFLVSDYTIDLWLPSFRDRAQGANQGRKSAIASDKLA